MAFHKPFRVVRPGLIATFLLIFLLASIDWLLNRLAIPPRKLGPYLAHRASGHNPVIEKFGDWSKQILTQLDRGEEFSHSLQDFRLGSAKQDEHQRISGNTILVQSSEEATSAIERAQPGDIITFLPGVYTFTGGRGYINAAKAGTETSRIVVRGTSRDSVTLNFSLAEGFLVTAPYWTFENLSIHGTCAQDSDCEHAFHVVGRASNIIIRNNTISDFNAHLKINSTGGSVPDGGLLEYNTLTNSHARKTAKPVTSIDLVAASHWTIRGNIIADFIKAEGDQISYGAYAKGGGTHNLFIGNMVICENRLHGNPGGRVGLSLGGGGTGSAYCRDRSCITEQQYSTLESNLILSCSDDGIHLNKAAASRIIHNTLLDTGPLVVRFPESSATVEGNLVDGAIVARNGGIIWASDNKDTRTTLLYLGLHPVRSLFLSLSAPDFSWTSPPPTRAADQNMRPDLCGEPRSLSPTFGAFEDFSRCRVSPPRSGSAVRVK